jgi:hypothetical protein
MRGLAVALLVVLAGCTVPVDPGAVGSPDDSPTAEPTATVDPDNPWRKPELTVAVRTAADDDRDYGPLLEEALSYWEANATRYAGYPLSFRTVDEEDDPDIVVTFVDEVAGCEGVADVAGCAPVPSTDSRVARPATVEIRTGLSDASTVTVLEHEFGHALGLRHDDEPQPLMAPVAQLTTLPGRDAVDRVLPWEDPELSVFVEYGNATDEGTVRDQVDHALAYYAAGAGGTVPENVTFTGTRNRSAADVVVQFRATACGKERGSCARRAGRDPDGDGALEYYTRLEVTLAGLDAPATAWHVAYWVGYGLGFQDDADWPAPLRNATYEERRSEWWDR